MQVLAGCWNYERGTGVTWVLELCDRYKLCLGVETLREVPMLHGCIDFGTRSQVQVLTGC